MANDIKLPLRPSNVKDFKIDKRAMDCLTYAVITGCRNATAFGIFYPEYTSGEGCKESDVFKLSDYGQRCCNQFFTNDDNKNYQASYRATLKAFLEGRGTARISDESISEDRKDNALKSLFNQAISLVERGVELDADTLKSITDIFRKLNILKEDVETEIRPLRFLPERCTSCRANIFVQSAVSNGEVLDMCKWCKARHVAEDNGYRFDEKNLLDIPQNILNELAEKNNISTADILSGKINN